MINKFINKIGKHICRIALFGSFAFGLLESQAQNLQPFVLTNGVNLIRSGAAAVDEFNVTDSSGFASTLLILDNSSATSTNTVKPSYISFAYSRLTNSVVFTNAAGVTQTNNFIYLSRVATTNVAVTNVAHILHRTVLPANGSITIYPGNAYTFGFGVQALLVGNTTNTPSAAGVMSFTPLP